MEHRASARSAPNAPAGEQLRKWNQELDPIVGTRVRAAVFHPSTIGLQLDFHTGACLRVSPDVNGSAYGRYTIRLDHDYW